MAGDNPEIVVPPAPGPPTGDAAEPEPAAEDD